MTNAYIPLPPRCGNSISGGGRTKGEHGKQKKNLRQSYREAVSHGHALTENRHGLIMAVDVNEANGSAETAAAIEMLDELRERRGVRAATVAEDKVYDSGPHLVELEHRGVTPHTAMLNTSRDPTTVRKCQWPAHAAGRSMEDQTTNATGRRSIQPGQNAQPARNLIRSPHRGNHSTNQTTPKPPQNQPKT